MDDSLAMGILHNIENCCGVVGTRVFVSVSTVILRLCILVRPRSIRCGPYSSSQIMDCTVSKHLPANISSALVLQPQYFEFDMSYRRANHEETRSIVFQFLVM
jgi:hypothetical protein